jgi:hypothetical protein
MVVRDRIELSTFRFSDLPVLRVTAVRPSRPRAAFVAGWHLAVAAAPGGNGGAWPRERQGAARRAFVRPHGSWWACGSSPAQGQAFGAPDVIDERGPGLE